jgi:hypothetical protein
MGINGDGTVGGERAWQWGAGHDRPWRGGR